MGLTEIIGYVPQNRMVDHIVIPYQELAILG